LEQLPKSLLVRRFGAFFIDHFIIVFFIVMSFFLVIDPREIEISSMLIRIILLIVCAFVLYGCKDIVNGRSIGKRFFGLAVRDNNQELPSTSKLIIRNLFTFLWPIELIAILISKQKRKIGDRLVNTDVYSVKNNKNILGIALSIASIVVFFVCIMFFGILQIIKQDESYLVATDFIKSSSEIKEKVGNEITFGYSPSGAINYENGYGNSDLTIKVKGEKGTTSVHIILSKEPNRDWEIESIDY